jgi:hypothetical protein
MFSTADMRLCVNRRLKLRSKVITRDACKLNEMSSERLVSALRLTACRPLSVSRLRWDTAARFET